MDILIITFYFTFLVALIYYFLKISPIFLKPDLFVKTTAIRRNDFASLKDTLSVSWFQVFEKFDSSNLESIARPNLSKSLFLWFFGVRFFSSNLGSNLV